MSLREFIRQNRQAIRDAIAQAYGEDCRPTSDEKTVIWIQNDEGLYRWALSEGVKNP